MATKSVTLDLDAYELLLRQRKQGRSVSLRGLAGEVLPRLVRP